MAEQESKKVIVRIYEVPVIPFPVIPAKDIEREYTYIICLPNEYETKGPAWPAKSLEDLESSVSEKNKRVESNV